MDIFAGIGGIILPPKAIKRISFPWLERDRMWHNHRKDYLVSPAVLCGPEDSTGSTCTQGKGTTWVCDSQGSRRARPPRGLTESWGPHGCWTRWPFRPVLQWEREAGPLPAFPEYSFPTQLSSGQLSLVWVFPVWFTTVYSHLCEFSWEFWGFL